MSGNLNVREPKSRTKGEGDEMRQTDGDFYPIDPLKYFILSNFFSHMDLNKTQPLESWRKKVLTY